MGDGGLANDRHCFNDQGMVNALRAFAELAPFFADDHGTMSQLDAEE